MKKKIQFIPHDSKKTNLEDYNKLIETATKLGFITYQWVATELSKNKKN